MTRPLIVLPGGYIHPDGTVVHSRVTMAKVRRIIEDVGAGTVWLHPCLWKQTLSLPSLGRRVHVEERLAPYRIPPGCLTEDVTRLVEAVRREEEENQRVWEWKLDVMREVHEQFLRDRREST